MKGTKTIVSKLLELEFTLILFIFTYLFIVLFQLIISIKFIKTNKIYEFIIVRLIEYFFIF